MPGLKNGIIIIIIDCRCSFAGFMQDKKLIYGAVVWFFMPFYVEVWVPNLKNLLFEF